MKTKVCCKCHTAKPTTEFYRSAAAKDSLQSQCKSCMIAYQTAYAGTVAAGLPVVIPMNVTTPLSCGMERVG